MGDHRGPEVDMKNFEETIKFLSKFDHLNAICFLLPQFERVINFNFQNCFTELFSYLKKNCVANICFCFTWSSSNFSVYILKKHLTNF